METKGPYWRRQVEGEVWKDQEGKRMLDSQATHRDRNVSWKLKGQVEGEVWKDQEGKRMSDSQATHRDRNTDRRTMKPKIWMYKDKLSGKPKGEATVTYDDSNAAKSAIDWFDDDALKQGLQRLGHQSADSAT
uniref:Uncharacterized protein n=1 Tax=Timema poppense TaxID=170557 RepID=A0A7R9D8N2_TIMPO|nr:unnamed protein product [Timema poppensis]